MILKGAYIIEEDLDGTFTATYDDDIICQTKDFNHILDVIGNHYTNISSDEGNAGSLAGILNF